MINKVYFLSDFLVTQLCILHTITFLSPICEFLVRWTAIPSRIYPSVYHINRQTCLYSDKSVHGKAHLCLWQNALTERKTMY